MEDLRVIIFAGPNGSGKSTVTPAYGIPGDFPGVYINADVIAAKELAHVPDARQRNMEAADIAESRRQAAMSNRETFAFETVMSTPIKLALIQEAKAAGYQVDLVFVSIQDPSLNVKRVAARVLQQGHGVDESAIRARYDRVMKFLPSAVALADSADIFDNSGARAVMVAQKEANKEIEFFDIANSPEWVTSRLAIPYAVHRADRQQLQSTVEDYLSKSIDLKVVIEDALIQHGKEYPGKLVAENQTHCLQQTGANVFVIHDKALMNPEQAQNMEHSVNKYITIAYKYGVDGKHASLEKEKVVSIDKQRGM